MKKYFSDFGETIAASKYMLGYIRQDGKGYIFLTILKALINAAFLMIYTIFPGLLINELIGAKHIESILIYAAAITISPLLQNLIYAVINNISTKKG